MNSLHNKGPYILFTQTALHSNNSNQGYIINLEDIEDEKNLAKVFDIFQDVIDTDSIQLLENIKLLLEKTSKENSSIFYGKDEIISLKPNFFGLGVDFNNFLKKMHLSIIKNEKLGTFKRNPEKEFFKNIINKFKFKDYNERILDSIKTSKEAMHEIEDASFKTFLNASKEELLEQYKRDLEWLEFKQKFVNGVPLDKKIIDSILKKYNNENWSIIFSDYFEKISLSNDIKNYKNYEIPFKYSNKREDELKTYKWLKENYDSICEL